MRKIMSGIVFAILATFSVMSFAAETSVATKKAPTKAAKKMVYTHHTTAGWYAEFAGKKGGCRTAPGVGIVVNNGQAIYGNAGKHSRPMCQTGDKIKLSGADRYYEPIGG